MTETSRTAPAGIPAWPGHIGMPSEPTPTDAVAIVTGGSWGAGRELARVLGSRGDAVVLVYLRDQRAAEGVVAEILAAHGTALVAWIARRDAGEGIAGEAIGRGTNVVDFAPDGRIARVVGFWDR